MTTLISLPARPDAPVACDMTVAEDSMRDRLAEYERLFEHALAARESSGTRVRFRFAGKPGVQEWLLDLVRREAACCAFLSYDVTVEDGELVWTLEGEGAADLAFVTLSK